jgi:hypothetical protein
MKKILLYVLLLIPAIAKPQATSSTPTYSVAPAGSIILMNKPSGAAPMFRITPENIVQQFVAPFFQKELPRITTTQMNALPGPLPGTMIFNTTANKYYSYISGAWTALGIQGAQGIQGIQGLTGNTGAIGSTGIQGIQGLTGNTGAIGSTGLQGIQGLTGNTGAIGATGLQGIQGLTGNTGAIGATGIQGIQGLIGNTGATGIQGIQGLTGNTGAIGATGIQGIQGLIGNTGAIGATGLQGIQGLIGNTGAIGATGIQGVDMLRLTTTQMNALPAQNQGALVFNITDNKYYSYINGSWSTTAVTGAIGATGLQGIQGVTGAQGIQGIQGIQGLTGASGSGASVTLQAIGSVPNGNAATLNGSVLNLEPATALFGGVVTTGAQTFAGTKTFTNLNTTPWSFGAANEMWAVNGTNGAATGYINYRGYNGGVTMPRSTVIGNGMGAPIVTFNGANSVATFTNPINGSITGNAATVTTVPALTGVVFTTGSSNVTQFSNNPVFPLSAKAPYFIFNAKYNDLDSGICWVQNGTTSNFGMREKAGNEMRMFFYRIAFIYVGCFYCFGGKIDIIKNKSVFNIIYICQHFTY